MIKIKQHQTEPVIYLKDGKYTCWFWNFTLSEGRCLLTSTNYNDYIHWKLSIKNKDPEVYNRLKEELENLEYKYAN